MTCRTLKTLATGKHIKPEQVQRPIVGMHPVPREGGGSVSEPSNKLDRVHRINEALVISAGAMVVAVVTLASAETWLDYTAGFAFAGMCLGYALWLWPGQGNDD